MKKLFMISSVAILCAGCSNAANTSTTLEQKLENPLFAEQYYDELVDGMVTLEINNDPLSEDETTKSIIEETRVMGLKKAKEANALQAQGKRGGFVSDNDYSTGIALLLDGKLYFSTTFNVQPSPDLHVHLSTVIDPRDVTYPDPTALDLGPIQSPYGEQTYVIPDQGEEGIVPRTVILWDEQFKRIFGFAQLAGQ